MNPFSRRRFLTLAAQASGAVGIANTLPSASWASPLGLPVGIQLYMVRDAMTADPAATLKELAAIGYREVEAAGYGKLTAVDYRRFIDAAGMTCPSVHLAFAKGTNFAPLFDEAHTLGATFATSSSMFPPAAAKTPRSFGSALGLDGFKYIVDLMNDIGVKAKAAGLKYAYHNHSHEFEVLPDGMPGYDYMLAHTDAELVKFEIDCGWMRVAGHNPADYLRKYPGRFRMLHIKDFVPITKPYTTAESGKRPDGAELGAGFIDYKPIFAAARTAGIVHVFAEQENPFPISQMVSAKADYRYLQSFS